MNKAPEQQFAYVTTLELIFEWFHRVIALYSLFYGLTYWVFLLGIYGDPIWRFDLMPVHWRVASVSLAVLFPFAASGLWMLAPWGVVIWFLCAVIEIVMYAVFPELFGPNLLIVISHVLTMLLYCVFRLVFFLRARAQPD